jgi:hypothetical protein
MLELVYSNTILPKKVRLRLCNNANIHDNIHDNIINTVMLYIMIIYDTDEK